MARTRQKQVDSVPRSEYPAVSTGVDEFRWAPRSSKSLRGAVKAALVGSTPTHSRLSLLDEPWISWRNALETLETAHIIVDVVASMMGSDVLLLDISEVTLIADYFVIATAESERQLRAIRDAVAQRLKASKIVPLSSEGTPASGWMLLDLGSIVVHLFSEEQREFYRLEELWSEARTVVRMA